MQHYNNVEEYVSDNFFEYEKVFITVEGDEIEFHVESLLAPPIMIQNPPATEFVSLPRYLFPPSITQKKYIMYFHDEKHLIFDRSD
jgi:hypothetical protein